jgi:hypothetical protein
MMQRFIRHGERIWFATGCCFIFALGVGILQWLGVIR